MLVMKENSLGVEYKNTPLNELIFYLEPCFGDFIVHNYVSYWQEKEFKN
jgi:hypothetical protein